MSRFSGRQGKGALRQLRAQRREEAEARQEASRQRDKHRQDSRNAAAKETKGG